MWKFIINNNEIKMANVECHFELAKEHTTTKGGGWVYYDLKERFVLLYNRSIDKLDIFYL